MEYWIWAHWFILAVSIFAYSFTLWQSASDPDTNPLSIVIWILLAILYQHALFAGGFW